MSADVQQLMRRMGFKLLMESDDVRRIERVIVGKKEVVIRIRLLDAPGDKLRLPKDPELKGIHKKLMSVLTTEPQTIRAIARAAGYSPKNSHVRAALYQLHKMQLIKQTGDGYSLA